MINNRLANRKGTGFWQTATAAEKAERMANFPVKVLTRKLTNECMLCSKRMHQGAKVYHDGSFAKAAHKECVKALAPPPAVIPPPPAAVPENIKVASGTTAAFILKQDEIITQIRQANVQVANASVLMEEKERRIIQLLTNINSTLVKLLEAWTSQ